MTRRWMLAAIMFLAPGLLVGTRNAEAQRAYDVVVRSAEVVHVRGMCGVSTFYDEVDVAVVRSESPRLVAGAHLVVGWSNCGIRAGCYRLALTDLEVRQVRVDGRVTSVPRVHRWPRHVECPED